ncbi:MAG: hypothetical protein WD270_02645 [Acetobacterales bacterium]
MSGPPWTCRVDPQGDFARRYRELAAEAPGAVDRLRARLLAFCKAPRSHGQFLRGSSDGRRERWLVPPPLSAGLLDELVAVVEVEPGPALAVPLRLHEIGAQPPQALVDGETRRAEADYGI